MLESLATGVKVLTLLLKSLAHGLRKLPGLEQCLNHGLKNINRVLNKLLLTKKELPTIATLFL